MSNNNTTVFDTYGDALKSVLLERNLEQQWLADRLETGDDQISRYINNRTKPGDLRQKQICELLGVSITQNKDGDWLVSEDEEVKKAFQSLDQVKDELASYKARTQSLDEIAQDLEFAKQTIERSLEKIDRIRGNN